MAVKRHMTSKKKRTNTWLKKRRHKSWKIRMWIEEVKSRIGQGETGSCWCRFDLRFLYTVFVFCFDFFHLFFYFMWTFVAFRSYTSCFGVLFWIFYCLLTSSFQAPSLAKTERVRKTLFLRVRRGLCCKGSWSKTSIAVVNIYVLIVNL